MANFGSRGIGPNTNTDQTSVVPALAEVDERAEVMDDFYPSSPLDGYGQGITDEEVDAGDDDSLFGVARPGQEVFETDETSYHQGRVSRFVGKVADVADRLTTLPSDRAEYDDQEDSLPSTHQTADQSTADYGVVEVDMARLAHDRSVEAHLKDVTAEPTPVADTESEYQNNTTPAVNPATEYSQALVSASSTEITDTITTPALGPVARWRKGRENEKRAKEVSLQLEEARLAEMRRQEEVSETLRAAEWQRVTAANELARQGRVQELNDKDAGYRLDLEASIGKFLDKPDPLANLWPKETVIGRALNDNYHNSRLERLAKLAPPARTAIETPIDDEFALSLRRETTGLVASKQAVVEGLLSGISDRHQSLVLDTDDLAAHEDYRQTIEVESRKALRDASEDAFSKLYRGTAAGSIPDTHVNDAFQELAVNAEINDAWYMTVTAEGHTRFRTRDVYKVAETPEGEVVLIRDSHHQGFRKIFDNPNALWRNVKTGNSVEGVIKTPKHDKGSTAIYAQYAGNEPFEPDKDGKPRVAILMDVVPLALNSEGDGVALHALGTDLRQRRQIDSTINPLARAEARVKADFEQDLKFDNWSDKVVQDAEAKYRELMLPSREVTFSVTETEFNRHLLTSLPEAVAASRANTSGLKELPEPPYGPVTQQD